MGNVFKIKAICPELSEQVNSMEKKIQEIFGIKISKIQASKIIAWKSKSYHVPLTEKKLVEILGGKL